MISSSTQNAGNDEHLAVSSTIASPQKDPSPILPYGKQQQQYDVVMRQHDHFNVASPLSPPSSTTSIKSPDSTTFLPLNSPPSSISIQSDALSPPPSTQPPSIDVNPPSNENMLYASLAPPNLYQQCTVCGDKASPENSVFGAVSCDSCGGFFKRTIKNERQFTCVANRDCVLNKKTRNRCKACRLQQCYKVGMKDKGILNTLQSFSR